MLDLEGNTIWGGWDASANGGVGAPLHDMVLARDASSVVYNVDGTASAALQDGQIYIWRLRTFQSKNNANFGGFRNIVQPITMGHLQVYRLSADCLTCQGKAF